MGSCLLSNGFERQRRTEFFFDGDFRRFVKTLIIGAVRGANFDNQPTILLLLVLNPSRRLKDRRLPFDKFDLGV